MYFELFHPETRSVFRGRRGKPTPFGHMFGGSIDYDGLEAGPHLPPVHLLLRLNMADPAVGVSLRGLDWLPLLGAIRYGVCDLGYRVLSETSVRILTLGETQPRPDFPYRNYPDKLWPQPLALEEADYDPRKIVDRLTYARIFGYGDATPEAHAQLVRQVEDAGLLRHFGYDTAEGLLADNVWPFAQRIPCEDCPDPACANHNRAASLRTFAIFEEAETRSGPMWGGSVRDLQILFQICPRCDAIRVTSQTR